MLKITNDGLTRSGAGCFIAVYPGNSGRQGVNRVAVFNLDAAADIQSAMTYRKRTCYTHVDGLFLRGGTLSPPPNL